MSTRKCIAVSKLGCIRKNNEDNLLFLGRYLPENNTGTEEWLIDQFQSYETIALGVFDGMGGHENGELAADIAAKRFSEANLHADNMEKELIELCKNANEEICTEKVNKASNMGTTASVVVANCNNLWCLNVGDSPIYLFRGDYVKALYVEHTEKMLFEKLNINYNGKKYKLTQYVGMKEDEIEIEPAVCHVDLRENDTILICTDGLTDMVDLDEIKHEVVASNGNIRRSAKHLLERAYKNGGRDNITFILMRI